MSTDSITTNDDHLTAALARIPAFVDAGEAWLADVDPHWFNTVSPDELVMHSNTKCVLGQIAVAKGFTGGMAAYDLLREMGLRVDSSWEGQDFEVQHGFTAPWLVDEQQAYFEALRREWVGRIEARRAAA